MREVATRLHFELLHDLLHAFAIWVAWVGRKQFIPRLRRSLLTIAGCREEQEDRGNDSDRLFHDPPYRLSCFTILSSENVHHILTLDCDFGDPLYAVLSYHKCSRFLYRFGGFDTALHFSGLILLGVRVITLESLGLLLF